jgi:hypothetical protein
MKNWLILVASGLMAYGQTGQTQPPVENPQRTIRDASGFKPRNDASKAEPARSPRAAPASENGRGAGADTLDSLGSSTENLNVIRDANLRRLLKDGCAPAVSARIVELRARLGLPAEKTDHPAREGAKPEQSPIETASDWYKTPPVPANSSASATTRSADLLGTVMPGAKTDAPTKKASESETAALRTELEQLVAACPGAGKTAAKE